MFHSFTHPFKTAIVLCALLSSLVARIDAAPPPVGTWDFVLGGNQRGVAQVAFFDDGTIDGLAVFSFGTKFFVRTNSNGLIFTNQFGAAAVQGGWIYENTNRITGYINLISESMPGQGEVVVSSMSFRGNAKAERLNLVAYGSQGRVNFRGIPLTSTNDIDLGDGTSYLGTARVRKAPFPAFEIFTLTADTPNRYTVDGSGPGFTYSGILLVSNRRYAAIYQDRADGAGEPSVAAYAGPFNISKRRGSLLGTDGVNTVVRYRISPETP